MNEKIDTSSKPDRVLGDEWLNWAGTLDESKTYNETAKLFAVYAAITVLILLGCLGIILYLIEPRLQLLNPALVFFARILTILIISVSIICGTLILISVFTGKNLLFHTRLGQIAATRILPMTIAIARRLGISRDRLANSFVIFSNAIVKASHKPGNGKTIILLPRCLKADLKKEIQDMAKLANVGVFTAGGGGQARKIIIKERPSAVIGVACERDLISGIHDVAPKMPTFGVTNKRPEGPCKNTLINLDELKNAIETLTGKSLD
ncbi:MAG: DUF116 domain-containing protein [Planctomycetota bacterium]